MLEKMMVNMQRRTLRYVGLCLSNAIHSMEESHVAESFAETINLLNAARGEIMRALGHYHRPDGNVPTFPLDPVSAMDEARFQDQPILTYKKQRGFLIQCWIADHYFGAAERSYKKWKLVHVANNDNPDAVYETEHEALAALCKFADEWGRKTYKNWPEYQYYPEPLENSDAANNR